MNKNLKYLAYSFAVLFVGSMFSNCTKTTPDCSKNEFLQLALEIPYKQNDILKFTDSLGNKMSFTVTSAKMVYDSNFVRLSKDCPDTGYYYKKQFCAYNFSSSNPARKLFIGNYSTYLGNYYLVFSKPTKLDTLHNLGQSFTITIDSFYFSFWTQDVINNVSVIPEITLNGKKYQDVFVPTASFFSGRQVYFNKQLGIVSFKTNNVQWYLE